MSYAPPRSSRKMELWDILTRDGTPTGRTVSRGEQVFHRGEYHLVVHIWVTDGRGNFLIQKRSEERPLMPGEWAATGGSAVAGESSAVAALRELGEEMGIKTEQDKLTFIRRFIKRNSLVDVYMLKARVKVNELTLQTEEVAEARWVSSDDLKRYIADGLFHDYGEEYFKTVIAAAEKETEMSR